MVDLFAVSGPASRIGSPPSSSALLTDTALKNILASFGRTLTQELKSSVAGVERSFNERLGAVDLKMTCEFFFEMLNFMGINQFPFRLSAFQTIFCRS